MSAPSPTPSNMPPPASNLKRPRPSGAASSSQSAPQGTIATASGSRTKRRKPEPANVDDSDKKGSTAAAKGKEEDAIESGEVKTKIDFNELPVETLYKYLEYHDLLPRWDVSPWSEEPCTPPNQLYTLPSSAPIIPPPVTESQVSQTQEQITDQSSQHIDSQANGSTSNLPQTQADAGKQVQKQSTKTIENGNGPVGPQSNNMNNEPQLPQLPPSGDKPDNTLSTNEATTSASSEGNKNENKDDSQNQNSTEENGNQEGSEELADNFEPPTTRSKTLPTRQPNNTDNNHSSSLQQQQQAQIKRGVITLSDVYLAKEVLAEKANNHWLKGLGGGQNKEGETIVNFLYKMKVGQGRLLRVYNPTPPTYPWS
ncbi:uncharacterized protein L201_005677 [Kwoniella dendrophila CBS 6074]|uniref:Uncharacterized protein n=1 Tax=Kwoniella dendrophila CBS 6074 TaxID=1295534 RepID=A0AAX4K1U9_9TREE